MSRFEPLYRGAFGSSRSKSWLDALSVLATSLPLLLVWGMLLDMIGEGRWGGPSIAAVVLAVGASVVVMRDFRWRPYYAVPLVAAGRHRDHSGNAGGLAPGLRLDDGRA